MKLLKKDKLWKIVWVSGIYILLLLILYLVVVYKVEWEYKDLGTYLYIYDCDYNLCTSTVEQNKYYSRVSCDKNKCPYIKQVINDYVILDDGSNSWIYNYVIGNVISNKYISYRYIGKNMYVVKDNNDKFGIIDIDENIIIDLKYDNVISDYKNDYMTIVSNNLYGIISKDEKYKLNPTFDDIVLINDKIFAGKKDNIYQLHSYDKIDDDNNNKYNFVYSVDGLIFTVKDKKIDILDSNLTSTLLMKIDTYYEYSTGQERDSLRIHSDEKNIYFRVYNNDNQYTDYTYNIKNKKII